MSFYAVLYNVLNNPCWMTHWLEIETFDWYISPWTGVIESTCIESKYLWFSLSGAYRCTPPLYSNYLRSTPTASNLLQLPLLCSNNLSSSGHQLFISSLMLISKIICDNMYSSKSWLRLQQPQPPGWTILVLTPSTALIPTPLLHLLLPNETFGQQIALNIYFNCYHYHWI